MLLEDRSRLGNRHDHDAGGGLLRRRSSPAPAGAPDPRYAEELLLEHLRNGSVHPGLLEGTPAARETSCRRGHPLHVDAAGHSRCRICDAERKRRQRAEANLAAEPVV